MNVRTVQARIREAWLLLQTNYNYMVSKKTEKSLKIAVAADSDFK